jgi:hypothetical protein
MAFQGLTVTLTTGAVELFATSTGAAILHVLRMNETTN